MQSPLEPVFSVCQTCNKTLIISEIKRHFLDTQHTDFELKSKTGVNRDVDFHSMGKSLHKYIDIKLHHLIKEREYDEVVIKGKYDRWATISKNEKTGKNFNWKRPTARVNGNKIHILCFAGQDYVIHYALILFYYYHLNNLKMPKIILNIPKEEYCIETLNNTNLSELPKQDVIIMGYIDRLIGDFPEWEGDGDFRWKRFYIQNQKVALLGCKFSYWADISGRIVKHLANQGTKLVIYIGKLGGLSEQHIPNVHLATGEESLVDNEVIRWKNPFQNNDNSIIKEGLHITVPSILMETKDWLKNDSKRYSFVDPEIGFMARSALEEDIGFGFLHIISDNVMKEHKEDLSNEREKSVLEKRDLIIKEIRSALNRVFKNGRN